MAGAEAARTAVAVVGMHGRFAGAPTLDAFWRAVVAGTCLVRRHGRDELLASGVPAELVDAPGYVPADGYLDGADEFDEAFFGLSPREAVLTDPEHRLFVECAWAAMEDACHPPRATPLRVGCFATAGMSLYAGARMASYLTEAVLPDVALVESSAVPLISIANRPDYLATRVAYLLGLRGPALTVQTACSSSLVAVHLAVRALMAGECDLALAGGAAVHVPLRTGYLHQPGGLLSATGVCRPFDARADGTVGGNGVGVVVLRRLADALADGDPVRAVITGSAVTNDGADKSGFAAPGVPGQRAAVAAAHTASGGDPATIGLVEAHGTATRLGDPLEVRALRMALDTDARALPCALGAVKASVGHLDTAAGVAGLIKTVLAVQHGVIPPVVNHAELNPEIDLSGSSLYVPTTARQWPGSGRRRAAVSAFGAGGTNAHVVVEQADPGVRPTVAARPRLVAVSAKDAAAVRRCAHDLAAHLRAGQATLADAERTTLAARTPMPHTVAVAATSPQEAADHLERAAATGAVDPATVVPARPRPVVLLLPGQGGALWPFLRRALRDDPAFRTAFASLDDGGTLTAGVAEVAAADGDPRARSATWVQPAQVAAGLALANALATAGVRPAVLVGHSLGELAAAALAGVLTPADALALAAHRGELTDRLARPGGMLAVACAAATAERVLQEEAAAETAVAAHNAPESVVVAGPIDTLRSLAAAFARRGVRAATLRTTHAFHSPLMAAVAAGFPAAVATVRRGPAAVPVVSTVTGGAADLADPTHWGRHVREPVRFADAVRSPELPDGAVFVDLGAEGTLAGLVRAARPRAPVVALDRTDPAPPVLRLLLGLRAHGIRPDWAAAGTDGGRVPLPTYPFARIRHWPTRSSATRPAEAATRLVTVRWHTAPRPASAATPCRPLVLAPPGTEDVLAALRCVLPGARVLVGWDLDQDDGPAGAAAALRTAMTDADVLVAIIPPDPVPAGSTVGPVAGSAALRAVRAVVRAVAEHPVPTAVVTMRGTDADGPPDPTQAAVWGFVRAARTEHREWPGVLVDLGTPADLPALVAELGTGEPEIALRGGLRLTPVLVEAATGGPGAVPCGVPLGTVLVAGGTGGIAAHLVPWLAERGASRIVLAARTRPAVLPRAAGCPVVFVAADATDADDVARLETVTGPLSLVIAAAGVLRDRIAARTTAADLAAVFEPKVRAVVLLGSLADRHGCRLVALSSLAALLGSPGQAGYSAANLAMEAVVARLRAEGVAASAVGLGPWRGIGMSAALSGASGPRPLPARAWLDALARVPDGDAVCYALPDPLTAGPHTPRNPSPAALARAAWTAEAPGTAPESPADGTNPADGELGPAAAERLVLAAAAAVLGRPAAEIPPDAPFADLGLDSLAGLRLREDLVRRCGLELSTTLIYDHPTPRSLAGHLVRRAGRASAPDRAPSRPATSGEPGVVRSVADPVGLFALADEIARSRAALRPARPPRREEQWT